MIRRFPQTYRGMASVLKQLGPPKRPVHPFMANTELVEVSYPYWLKKTSTTLSNQILNLLKNSQSDTYNENLNENKAEARNFNQSELNSSFYTIPKGYMVDDLESEDSKFTSDILQKFESNDIRNIAKILVNNIQHEKRILDPELVNILIKLSLSEIPLPDTLPYDCEVEIPIYRKSLDVNNCQIKVTDSPFYRFIFEQIPSLYEICKLYYPIMGNSKDFQEYYIWLCFHMNDLNTLDELTNKYLQNNQTYDSKVLCYVISAWIMNYETTIALEKFRLIMTKNSKLDPILFETTVQMAIHYDSLFENICEFYNLWKLYGYDFSPKSIALLIRVYTRHGTAEEIKKITNELINMENYQNYQIRAQIFRSKLLRKNPSRTFKKVDKSDLKELHDISSQIENEFEKKDYYYQMLKFFSSKKNEQMVIYILHCMKKDGLEIDSRIVKVISKLYVRNERFITLYEFLQFSSKRIEFNEEFLVDIYNGFVKSYPFKAQEFDKEFRKWAMQKGNERGAKYLSVLGLEKQSAFSMYPYKPQTLYFKPIKYNENWWKIKGNDIKQIRYRFSEGFKSLHEKGVKPDFHIIEETYRVLPKVQRYMILDVMKASKSESSKKRLAIYRLANDNYSKKYFLDFLEHEGNGLNAQNRLHLTGPLMKIGLGYKAKALLNGIKPEELNDKLKMMKLCKQLSVSVYLNDMKKFTKLIDQFPLDEITLNPFFYQKCCELDTKMTEKINKGKVSKESQITISDALEKLRGFIGDIRVRLESDNIELNRLIKDVFKFLSEWIEKDEIDMRKL